MKRQLLLAALVVVCVTRMAGAAQISIGVYADDGISCNIMDDQPGLLTVYVMMSAPDGATAAQFAAPKPACMAGATYLSDTCWPVCIGGSQDGIAIGFGSCVTGFFYIMGINYFGTGTTASCCLYPVIPDPHVASGKIEATDCDYQLVYPWREMSTVNGDSSCPCGYPVAIEETTWGKVKSMYVE